MRCVCLKIIVIIHFMFNSLSHNRSCRAFGGTLGLLSHIQPYISHTCQMCACGLSGLGRGKVLLSPETKHWIKAFCL